MTKVDIHAKNQQTLMIEMFNTKENINPQGGGDLVVQGDVSFAKCCKTLNQ